MITYLLIGIILIYCCFIVGLIYGFSKINSFYPSDTSENLNRFSLIIPFRNEAKKLPQLLESLKKLNYPKNLFEVILIDDQSTDASVSIYNKWRIANGKIPTTLLENLRLTSSPKKDAIARAIPIVKNEWIVTTDADCEVPKNWLHVLDAFIQKTDAEMVVGSVIYKTKNNWFHHFQQLDLMALQGTTIGSFGLKNPFMCNGANFAYTKKIFLDLKGFENNTNYASGDDVFLLQKAVQKDKSKVLFLKNRNFIVTTKPENSLYKLFMQRVRWASKTGGYKNWYAKFLAFFVLAGNFCIVLAFLLAILQKLDWMILLLIFGCKYVLDFVLLLQSNLYLRNGKYFVPFASSVIYPIFCCLVGFYSFFGVFEWKNRKLR